MSIFLGHHRDKYSPPIHTVRANISPEFTGCAPSNWSQMIHFRSVFKNILLFLTKTILYKYLNANLICLQRIWLHQEYWQAVFFTSGLGSTIVCIFQHGTPSTKIEILVRNQIETWYFWFTPLCYSAISYHPWRCIFGILKTRNLVPIALGYINTPCLY